MASQIPSCTYLILKTCPNLTHPSLRNTRKIVPFLRIMPDPADRLVPKLHDLYIQSRDSRPGFMEALKHLLSTWTESIDKDALDKLDVDYNRPMSDTEKDFVRERVGLLILHNL